MNHLHEDLKESHRSLTLQSNALTIPGDVVNKATAAMKDDARSAIRWLHNYGVEHGLTTEELAAKLKQPGSNKTYSKDSVYQLLTGRRESGIENMVSAIESFREIIEKRASVKKTGFVETALTKRIFQVCETALTYQKINFIYGDSQIGKTTALEEYQRTHNHGETIYVRMPQGGCLSYFIVELAKALRMSPQLRREAARNRIISAFDDRMLLIVDEIHQVFIQGESRSSYSSLEFIREIHDRAKCGVIMSGTNVFRDMLLYGNHKKIMTQFERRSLVTLQLDPKPSSADLKTFAARYGLPPATGEALDLQTAVIAEHGLGKWMSYLQAGSRVAEKDPKSSTMAWTHVQTAYTAIQSLASTKA